MKLLPLILRAAVAMPVAGPMFMLAKILPEEWRFRKWLAATAFSLMGLGI